MVTTADRNTSILLQISALTQYFFPLGNYIFPLVIWSIKKDQSEFVNRNGKQAINFQLSLLVYVMALMVIAIPVLLYNIFNNSSFMVNECQWVAEQFTTGKITTLVMTIVLTAMIFTVIKVLEFCLIIYAAVKNSNGEVYQYPLTIKFIK